VETILMTHVSLAHLLPEFLADQQVEIVASLPCYLAENAGAGSSCQGAIEA
jgi:hypothetical protein